MSGGAAAGDFDEDGNVDLFVTRLDAPDILYRNTGDGMFEDVTVTSGIDRGFGSNGAGWSDVDNDGDLDLYVTSLSDSRFYLYINDGTGVFTEEAQARGAAVEGPDEHFGYSVTFGDYDNDDYLDIHTTEWRPISLNPTGSLANSRLLRNLGTANPGYFEDVTQGAGVALDGVGPRPGSFSFASRFSDLDGDGFVDLAIASDFGESRLFWNNRNGTFTDGTDAAGVETDENGMGSAIGDVNGDGLLDWFVTAIFDPDDTCSEPPGCNWGASGNRLYLNNGDRTFTDVTDVAGVRDGYWGWGATFIDYDNDRDLDLVMTNGVDFPWSTIEGHYEDDPMRFWENDGRGNFSEISSLIGLRDTGSGKGLLKFDYDNDGDLDLLVVNNGSAPVLYRNDGGNANGWLRIKPVGVHPAAGTKITVQFHRYVRPQIWEVHAGNNFLGQDEIIAHFGLGKGSQPVYRVTIEWPDGAVEVLENVARNTTVVIDRGG